MLTPDSIKEALRTYLHPIKNDDPKLDFYTMYKQETMDYDTEHVNKYNEDLDTTLIFVSPCFLYRSSVNLHVLRPAYSLQSIPPSS